MSIHLYHYVSGSAKLFNSAVLVSLQISACGKDSDSTIQKKVGAEQNEQVSPLMNKIKENYWVVDLLFKVVFKSIT